MAKKAETFNKFQLSTYLHSTTSVSECCLCAGSLLRAVEKQIIHRSTNASEGLAVQGHDTGIRHSRFK